MKDWEKLDQKYLGGPFDRQVRIEDWDQDILSKQAVLVLGIGGLGSVVVSSLMRLGVAKIFMVDYDVVDIHNLNRQILFSSSDVGKPKVQAAFANAQFHKSGNTTIQFFHGNALTNWQTIVEFAKRSSFVYNCIDWGDKFDMAVTSLCLKLSIPLVMGGTFSTSMTIDFFPSKGRPCYLCTETINEPPEMWDAINPDIIADLKDISFLPKNNNPIGRSSMVVCTICGEIMVAHFLNWLFLSEEKPYRASRIIFYHNTFEIVKFELEQFKKCPFCATPEDLIEYEKEQQKKKEEEQKKKEEEQIKKEEQMKKEEEGEKKEGEEKEGEKKEGEKKEGEKKEGEKEEGEEKISQILLKEQNIQKEVKESNLSSVVVDLKAVSETENKVEATSTQ